MASRHVIHFVVRSGPAVLPLCGSWGESTDWTTASPVANCPGCIRELQPLRTPPAFAPLLASPKHVPH